MPMERKEGQELYGDNLTDSDWRTIFRFSEGYTLLRAMLKKRLFEPFLARSQDLLNSLLFGNADEYKADKKPKNRSVF